MTALSWRDLDRVPWDLVDQLRSKAADALTAASKDRGLDQEAHRELGRATIETVIDEWNKVRASIGERRSPGPFVK
jgi:hypothetical protein